MAFHHCRSATATHGVELVGGLSLHYKNVGTCLPIR